MRSAQRRPSSTTGRPRRFSCVNDGFLLCELQLNAHQVPNGPRRPFVFRDDQFQWAGVLVEGLAVHRVSDKNLSGMKTGIDFCQSEYRTIPIRTGRNNVAAQCRTTKFVSQRSAELAE